METKLDYITDTKARIKLLVPNNEILPIYVKALEKANIVLNAGKINKKEDQFSDFVKRDVCNTFVKKYFESTLKNLDLVPISKVDFNFDPWDEKQDFEFTATFEVKPKLVQLNYSGLEKHLDLSSISIPESMIDHAIANIQTQKQTLTLMPRTTPAEVGLLATIDVDAFVAGKPFPEANARGFQQELLPENSNTELHKGVLGKKVGEQFEFNFHYPKDFQDSKLAGKSVLFKVRLVELRKAVRPQITDEFVRELFISTPQSISHPSVPKTVLELRSQLKTDLQFTLEQQRFLKNKEIAMRELAAQNRFDVPSELLKNQYQSLIEFETNEHRKSNSPLSLEEHLRTKKSELLKNAEYLVQCALLVDAFAKRFQIGLDPADFESYYQKFARLRGAQVDHVRKTLGNPKFKPQVAYSIIEDKVVEHVMKLSNPKLKVS